MGAWLTVRGEIHDSAIRLAVSAGIVVSTHVHTLQWSKGGQRPVVAWGKHGDVRLVRRLVSGRDVAPRRPRGEEGVPSGNDIGGPQARDEMVRCHGGSRATGGRRRRAAFPVG
jgi:hypothetical protein